MSKAIQGITVAHFFETYRDKLKMELLTGDEGMHRMIREGSINRPSLALTGFFKYFANKRIQVLGAAEMTYFKTLPQPQQIAIVNEMASRQIPCLVLTRNFNPTPAMLAVAQERDLPIFRTPMITMNYVNLATLCIDNEFAPHTTEHATMLDIRGIGVLITDHNVRETLRIVDRAYIIRQGKVLTEGTGEFLINDPQARKYYLGEDFNM